MAEQNKTPHGVAYARLCEKNPLYNADRTNRYRALYHGGSRLLESELLEELFPRHGDEDLEVYRERKKRAHYTNYAGALIDYVAGALGEDPLELQVEGGDGDFWAEWPDDVSPAGGDRMTLNKLAATTIRNFLIDGVAWTLVDLPDSTGKEYASLAEQDVDGARRAYAMPIDAMNVYDWEVDSSGKVLWACVCYRSRKRSGIEGDRLMITETFYVYTETSWSKFVVSYHDEHAWRSSGSTGEMREKPKPNDVIPAEVWESPHNFGGCPLVVLQLSEGLWMMNKLYSLAKEYFNRECMHGWSIARVLNPQLYEFLAPEMEDFNSVPDAIKSDPNRAMSKRGIGYVNVRAQGDDAKYVGPGADSFSHIIESLRELRDAMYREVNQMGNATDNSAAALSRSGVSKAKDDEAFVNLLREYGRHARDFVRLIVERAKFGRGEPKLEALVRGMDQYDRLGGRDLVEQAVALEGIEIPSATFQRKFLGLVARTLVGPECSDEEKQAIMDELEKSISQDQLTRPEPPPSLPPPPPLKKSEEDEEDEDEDDDETSVERPRR